MILRKTVLAAGALVALLATASVGSAKPAAPAGSAAAAPVQCSTKLLTLRPHYPDPVKPLAGAASSLSGAGATLPGPVYSMWAQAYSKKGTNVAYQAIGSGGGISQINAQTVDFGDSDVPMTDAELAAAKGGPILHIPVVLGAVAMAYNIPGVGGGLNFDADTIGKIYTGQITNWNDPAIKALNPKANLPDLAIAVVHRSDSSGTTGVFTDFLTKASASWVAKLGAASYGKTVAWPLGIGGKGSDGVTALVGQTKGSIGYVELQYAIAGKLTYGNVKNKKGTFITPCIATATAAALKTSFPPDMRASLTWKGAPNAYPITATTFMLVYQNQTDAGKAKALVNFLTWALTTGQNFPATINFAPMGKILQQRALAQVNKIKLNGQPLVKIPISYK
ncbi:MAG: phosphate ABC transporter substrate-binding protein PstS [Actinomycetota bacterium]|nr:phosphate ABC transporter substrate-binding protein PstS [Actinomycetota bacterium]